MEDDPGIEEFKQALLIYKSIKESLWLDYESGKSPNPKDFQQQYNEGIDLLKTVVEKYPGTVSSILAMNRITDCYWYLEDPESVAGYLNSLLEDSKYCDLFSNAENLLIPYHLYFKNYEKALELADKILKETGKKQLSCEVLLMKGIIYKHFLKDKEKAIEIFNAVLDLYPDNMIVLSARAELEEMGEKVPEAEFTITAEEEITELSVDNYPNPFNPVTNIEFSLSEECRVVFEIYNVLGQKIATLLDVNKQAGQHIVKWNGTNDAGIKVSAGIYLVRMRARTIEKSIKVMLLP